MKNAQVTFPLEETARRRRCFQRGAPHEGQNLRDVLLHRGALSITNVQSKSCKRIQWITSEIRNADEIQVQLLEYVEYAIDW